MRCVSIVPMLMMCGCLSADRGVPARTQSDRPDKGHVPMFTRGTIIDGAYLMLPVILEEKGALAGSIKGDPAVCTNLEIVDFGKKIHHRVFSSPVLVEDWSISFAPAERASYTRYSESNYESLRFPSLLIVRARTVDADHDGELTGKDPAAVFGYDIDHDARFQISPEGMQLADCRPIGQRLLLTFSGPQQSLGVYLYDLKARSGEFVARDLSPR